MGKCLEWVKWKIYFRLLWTLWVAFQLSPVFPRRFPTAQTGTSNLTCRLSCYCASFSLFPDGFNNLLINATDCKTPMKLRNSVEWRYTFAKRRAPKCEQRAILRFHYLHCTRWKTVSQSWWQWRQSILRCRQASSFTMMAITTNTDGLEGGQTGGTARLENSYSSPMCPSSLSLKKFLISTTVRWTHWAASPNGTIRAYVNWLPLADMLGWWWWLGAAGANRSSLPWRRWLKGLLAAGGAARVVI